MAEVWPGDKDAVVARLRYLDVTTAPVRPGSLRLTTDWIELSIHFLARTRGVRDLKDAISRVLDGFDAAGIAFASKTFAIVRTKR